MNFNTETGKLLDNLLEGFQIIDFNWRYIYLNKTAEEQGRTPRNELIGKKFTDVWPGVEKTPLFEVMKDCLENKNSHKLENEFQFPDGNPGWFDLSIQPVEEGIIIISNDITERKISENKSKKSIKIANDHIQRTQYLLDNISVGISVLDKNAEVIFNNKTLRTILKLSQKDIQNKRYNERKYFDSNNKELKPNEFPSYIAAHKGKSISDFEIKIQLENGENIWTKVSAVPLELEDWKVLNIVVDITDNKLAELELKESEEKFRAVFDQAAAGVAIIETKTGKYLKINKQYCNFLGYSEEEMLQKTFMDVTHPDDVKTNIDANKNLSHKKWSEFNYDKRYFKKDGKIVWGNLTISPLWKDETSIESFQHIAIVTDITKRKEIELKSSRLSQIVEQSPATIVITDLKGNIEYANNAFTKKTGYTLKDALGKNPRILKSGKTDEKVYKDLWETITQGKTWEGEFINRKKSGEDYYERVVVAPFKNDNDNVINYFAIKEDISDRKDAEFKLKESAKKLAEANITKDKFFSIIAHDLKNPFNVINGLTDLLITRQDSYDKEKFVEFTKTINRSGKQTLELLENLLEWARSQSGKMTFHPEELILKNVLIETTSILQGLAKQKNISLEYTMDKPIVLTADSSMINTILRNLITNALKFTPNGGSVKINTAKTSESVIIEVKDTGVGMNSEQINNLFNLTSKSNTLGTNKERGTGLGLILCKEFIEKHGGKIHVHSEINRGTTFSVELPQ